MEKTFVEVISKFLLDGSQRPISIIWSDGRTFHIDKILDIRKSVSLKSGGKGMRYTCRIKHKIIHLFNDHHTWFIDV